MYIITLDIFFDTGEQVKQGTQDSVRTVDRFGTERWRNADGKYHRLDGPAYVGANGTREWWVDGKLHRLDGPAVVGADGTRVWFVDGQLHRLDGPAWVGADGTREWRVDGRRVDMELRLDGDRAWSSVRVNR